MRTTPQPRRWHAVVLSLAMLVTAACGSESSDPIEAGDDFLARTEAGEPVVVEDIEDLASVGGFGSVCELLVSFPPRYPQHWWYDVDAVIEQQLSDEILEHIPDFPDDPLAFGPHCLWEQELNELVTNQVSIAVVSLEDFDVIRGQGGEEVDVGKAYEPSALEVHFDPTDDPPSSMPDSYGIRVWHRGEVNLFYRRAPVEGWVGHDNEHIPYPFPGAGIMVSVSGEITMLPANHLRDAMMEIASVTENNLYTWVADLGLRRTLQSP